MPEGHDLEKHEIVPQPTVDFKSVLERGEIESAETLEGYFSIKVVKIKDDGRAIFRPDGTKFKHLDKVESLRSDLELLAFSIDQILEFNLVPTIVSRNIDQARGTVQSFMENAKLSYEFENWPDLVHETELLQAPDP